MALQHDEVNMGILVYLSKNNPVEQAYQDIVIAACKRESLLEPVFFWQDGPASKDVPQGDRFLSYARRHGAVLIVSTSAAEVIQVATAAWAVGAGAVCMGIEPWRAGDGHGDIYDPGHIICVPMVTEYAVNIAVDLAIMMRHLKPVATYQRGVIGATVQAMLINLFASHVERYREVERQQAVNVELAENYSAAQAKMEENIRAEITEEIEARKLRDLTASVEQLAEAFAEYRNRIANSRERRHVENCEAIMRAAFPEVVDLQTEEEEHAGI